MNIPPGYERKFAGFIRLCQDSSKKGISQVMIEKPSVLGDTYEEVVESLSRLARADLALHIDHPE